MGLATLGAIAFQVATMWPMIGLLVLILVALVAIFVRMGKRK